MPNQALLPQVLPMRQRAEVIYRLTKQRLHEIMLPAMRANGIDCWLILCQEDNLDPVYTTLIPMDTWCPILQLLLFFDRGEAGLEGINISGTNTRDLYQRPYTGQLETEQWPLLIKLISERNPQRIGINIGSIQWAAGGLTHNLYQQLCARLPSPFVERLVSAEPLATRWLSTLTTADIEMYEHICQLAHQIIAECYSRQTIIPGYTTLDDLTWAYWQRCADHALRMAFMPSFRILRRPALRAQYDPADRVIRTGDLLHCDVGFQYLRLNADHQQLAYVLLPGEEDAPAGLRQLLAEGNRLQEIYMANFAVGLSGNQLLHKVLTQAQAAGIPTPKVYSHSVGLFLHEPGPLIGLPWEQENNPGRGDVTLECNSCFTMELSVQALVAEWDGEEVRLPLEEIVAFTADGCRPLAGRQTKFHLI